MNHFLHSMFPDTSRRRRYIFIILGIAIFKYYLKMAIPNKEYKGCFIFYSLVHIVKMFDLIDFEITLQFDIVVFDLFNIQIGFFLIRKKQK